MDTIFINTRLTIPNHEFWFTTSRSGGPGGQHVNRTESRVTLHWCPEKSGVLSDYHKKRIGLKLKNRINEDGVLQIHVETQRSQLRNKEEACKRLAELVRGALVRPKKRIATKPSYGAKKRRLKAKKNRSETKKMRKKPSSYTD